MRSASLLACEYDSYRLTRVTKSYILAVGDGAAKEQKGYVRAIAYVHVDPTGRMA